MVEPIAHHRASGIHPGAFVQDTEPDIAALGLQEGVLWLDTSTVAPLAVKVVRSGAWALLCTIGTGLSVEGVVATACITFPNGASICNAARDVLEFRTPAGAFAMDATGLSVPGGHRLERVAI